MASTKNRSKDSRQSAALREVLQLVETVAKGIQLSPLAETGTGKELIARNSQQQRRDRGFVKLNCAAIPGGLLERAFWPPERSLRDWPLVG